MPLSRRRRAGYTEYAATLVRRAGEGSILARAGVAATAPAAVGLAARRLDTSRYGC